MTKPIPPEKQPRVIFVLLNWNQGQMTIECLDSMKDLVYSNYQVVIVDNGSTDGSAALIRARFPQHIVLENKSNLGYSEGNNVGIRYALEQECDYIFLLNNDTYVDPCMLHELVQAAEADPRAGITGPTMFYAEPRDVLWGGENTVSFQKSSITRKYMNEVVPPDALNGEPVETGYIDSCAVLVKKAVFEKIGLMDSKFFINFDDVDLNFRARRAGYKIYYVPRARMWHRVSAAMGVGSPATTYYMTRNSLLFFTRHAPGLRKASAFLQILWRTTRTVGAWTLLPKYREPSYRRRRAANLYGLRDFFLGRFGRMGEDVAKACFGK